MNLLLFLFVFFVGCIVGSFLNVAILRGVEKESFGGRSKCLSCGKILSWFELIPVVSFLMQKGRCRSCGAELSWQYPLVELGTGILYAASAWHILGRGASGYLDAPRPSEIVLILLAFVALSAAVVILVSDFRFEIIPNGAVFILFLVGVAALALRLSQTKFRSAIDLNLVWDIGGALAAALFLAALWFFSKGGWMGFGDVKLIFATSLLLGFPNALAALLFSFWLGGIAGIVLLLSRRKTLKSHIPFGPFILLGTVLAYFFAEELFGIMGV